jgi:hypothetical protein
MKTDASRGIVPTFLTSALDWGVGSTSRPCRFTPRGKRPRTPSVWKLWRRGKSCNAGNRTRAVQPVAIPTELSLSYSIWNLFFLNGIVFTSFCLRPSELNGIFNFVKRKNIWFPHWKNCLIFGLIGQFVYGRWLKKPIALDRVSRAVC